MKRFVIARLLWAVPVIFAVLIANFLLLHLVPGDPVSAFIGDFPAPPEYVQKLRGDFGLDEPAIVQLALYLKNLLSGNLGYSFFNRQPVSDVLLERTINTILLMAPVLVISSLAGIALGLLSATRKSSALDVALTSLSLLGKSVPIFWSGQVLIIFFAVYLQLLPPQGMQNVRSPASGLGALWDFLAHWIMPGSIAIAFNLAVVARVARVSFKQALTEDFVLTGRAAGLSERRVMLRHVVPNGLIPVITVIGHNLGNILTGTIMVEAVFGWPGLGGLFMGSIASRDYPVLQAIFLMVALATILANLITDIGYALVDPRVRHGYVGR